MPPVVVGVPERCLTGMDGGRQEPEEGIELVFGVPGNDRVSHDPMSGGEEPDAGDGKRHRCRTEPCVSPRASPYITLGAPPCASRGTPPCVWRRAQAKAAAQ